MYKKDRTLFVRIVAFICAMIFWSFILGPTTCRDGWRSPSIGSRGACSWHGGVDRTKGFIKLILSLGITWGAVGFYSSRRQAWEKNNRIEVEGTDQNHLEVQTNVQEKVKTNTLEIKQKEIEETSTMCPICGASMKLRKARRGRHAGNLFFGCSTYPRCRGIRNYSHQ